jgi:hypothetical protein
MDYSLLNGHDLENDDWFDMPEFKWSDSLHDRYVVEVQLNNEMERTEFFKMFNHNPTVHNYIHYELDEHPLKEHEYEFTHKIHPKYPIYVITKGRWEKTMTIDTLEEMGIDFRICVEPSEYDNYIANPRIDINKVIRLPENFSERKQGGIPVRNFVWHHSVERGYEKHWIIDDNILGFFRWNENTQKKVKDGVFFRIMEDFSDRYENIGLVSCQYTSFIPAIDVGRGQFIRNTRTYSCILINSKLLDERLEERWRGTYNEDTDLSLRVLKDGWCTILFNAFLAGKVTTMRMKGGNTDNVYTDDDNRLKFAKALEELHPDVVRVVWKFNRWHHQVNYRPFKKNKLIKKKGLVIKDGVNEYGMKLKNISNSE